MNNQGRGYHRGRNSNNSRFSNRSGRSGNRSHNSNSRRGSNNSNNIKSNNVELKFVPHYSGKQQVVTYDSVKEHIIQHIQKNYKYGNDMAKALRNDAYSTSPGGPEPIRVVVKIEGDSPTAADIANQQMIQQGHDIKYQEELKDYNSRKLVYEDNKIKAYALIFGYCNKVMQNRIEETPTFESKIRDDP